MADGNIHVLGKISTAFGIKGWVKVYSYTDPMANILDYGHWYIRRDGQWQKFRVMQGKLQGKGLVAALEGVTDRDLALALSQCEIGIPESELPEPDDDEHYWFQLEGLSVINTDDQLLGQVKELFDSGGGNQVLTVKPCVGSVDQQTRLLPYVSEYILEVDLDAGVIQVDWDPDF